MPLTNEDLTGIATVVEKVVDDKIEPLIEDLKVIRKNQDSMMTTLDGFSTTVRRHEQEWLILRKQHEKIRDILVKKGIASEEEMAIA